MSYIIKSVQIVIAAFSLAVVLSAPFVAMASKSSQEVDGYGFDTTVTASVGDQPLSDQQK